MNMAIKRLKLSQSLRQRKATINKAIQHKHKKKFFRLLTIQEMSHILEELTLAIIIHSIKKSNF